jgi:hypothetical protein
MNRLVGARVSLAGKQFMVSGTRIVSRSIEPQVTKSERQPRPHELVQALGVGACFSRSRDLMRTPSSNGEIPKERSQMIAKIVAEIRQVIYQQIHVSGTEVDLFRDIHETLRHHVVPSDRRNHPDIFRLGSMDRRLPSRDVTSISGTPSFAFVGITCFRSFGVVTDSFPRRVGQASQKQDCTRVPIADGEQEGVVSAEDGNWRRL